MQAPDIAPSASGSGLPTFQSFIDTLNDAQKTAVTSPQDLPLQILAGPGSGKTRVLTARVAYLVRHVGLKPWEITAVTFTNKAAQEMRKRLNVLLGEAVASKLILGTFHATCASYLRKHGQVIDLPNNFSITDADDSKKIIKTHLKALASILSEAHIQLKDAQVLGEISKAKAREESPAGMGRRAKGMEGKGEVLVWIAEVYRRYEESLREADSLDFDDLLVFGLKLFRAAPRILANCKHILVDEFQDTNTTQYELMKLFAKAHGCVTIVGDPDQSIYGWRAAEIENLNHMKKDFPDTAAIYLEENYRSTGAILAASLAVVSQDKARIAKGLFTSHPIGNAVTLKTCPSAFAEAAYIANEVKRMIAFSGGMLGHGDFAILLRYNALSRPIEVALQKERIPNKVIGGHKFFERLEVKDLLAYLQLVDNPNFTPAFVRVVNVPKRAIGDKSVADLLAQAKGMNISPMELAERAVAGETLPGGVKPALKRNLGLFVKVIQDLRKQAQRGMAVVDLIKLCIERTEYEEHLRKTQADFDSRWENVQELISYAVLVAEEQSQAIQLPEVDAADLPGFESARNVIVPTESSEPDVKPRPAELYPVFRRSTSDPSTAEASSSKADTKPQVDVESGHRSRGKGKERERESGWSALEGDGTAEEPLILDEVAPKEGLPEGVDVHKTPLRVFLQASMLSTDTEAKDDGADVPKVTISTVHGAKGLEWPIVFLPCVESGVYPFYRCVEEAEVREERRLLYVAMTRAQAGLYLSHAQYRMMGGDEQDRELSSFVTGAKRDSGQYFDAADPVMTAQERLAFAKILGRDAPDEAATATMIAEHNRTANPVNAWDKPYEPRSHRLASGFGGLPPLWFNSGKKERRATEYWESEADEYALPDEDGNMPKRPAAKVDYGGKDYECRNPGFAAAIVSASGSPKKRGAYGAKQEYEAGYGSPPSAPPKPIARAKLEYPEPLPFAFMSASDTVKQQMDFTKTQASSLSLMKSLGLPSPSVASSSKPSSTSPSFSSVSTFQSSSNSSLSFMKNLGLPDRSAPAGTAGVGAKSEGTSIGVQNPTTKLGAGNKRLGMGRPQPWGAKKPKLD